MVLQIFTNENRNTIGKMLFAMQRTLTEYPISVIVVVCLSAAHLSTPTSDGVDMECSLYKKVHIEFAGYVGPIANLPFYAPT